MVGFFDELMCALGEIASYVGVVDHGRQPSLRVNEPILANAFYNVGGRPIGGPDGLACIVSDTGEMHQRDIE